MLSRRRFFVSAAGAVAAAPRLTPKERVLRALRGEEIDRVPFTFWHHFGTEKQPAEKLAAATLDYHRRFRTDLVKVMSDYPYPKPSGKWYQLKVESNPFPEQIRALQSIRQGLAGDAWFVETIFNPWKVAENLSSPGEVMDLMRRDPQALLAALQTIAESESNHARKAVEAGAAGVFLAIANAQDGFMTRDDYQRFSNPFDRMVLQAAAGAPLNTLHLHGDKVYLDLFTGPWPAAAINYSAHGTRVSVAEMRRKYVGLLMAGIDEVNFRTLDQAALRAQWQSAQQGAGKHFVLTPGCSVPNDTTDEEHLRLTRLIGA